MTRTSPSPRGYVTDSTVAQGNRIESCHYELLGRKTAEEDNRVTRVVSRGVLTLKALTTFVLESFAQYQYSTSGKRLIAESYFQPSNPSQLLYQVSYDYDKCGNLAHRKNGATDLEEWWAYSNSDYLTRNGGAGFQGLQSFDFANAQSEGVRYGVLAYVINHSILNKVPTQGSTQYVQAQYDYWNTAGWTGNLEQERRWDGQKWCTVTYKYNPNGTVQEKTEGTNGPKTTYSYSGPNGAFLAGTSATVHDVDGNASNVVTSYQYYVDGLQSQETDPRGKITTYAYDRLARLEEVTRPDGLKRFYDWRDAEDACYVTDQVAAGRQQTTRYEFDGLGHIRFVTRDYQLNPVSGSKTANTKTEYQYNANWLVSGVVESHESGEALSRYTTSYEYDAIGRVQKVLFPYDTAAGDKQTYAQLNYGVVLSDGKYVNQATILDELGHTTTESKDLGGRLVKAAVQNISQVGGTSFLQTWTFAYDSLGRKTYSKTPGGKEVWSNYDSLGQLTKTATQPISVMSPESDAVSQLPVTSAYGYDDRGNRVWEIGPNGHLGSTGDAKYKIEYQYDELNRLIRATEPLSDAQGARITKVYYDGCGNKVKVVDGNGLETSYTYDARGRLSTEKNPAGEITAYTYDGLGNRTSVTDPRGSATVAIDGDFTTWYVYDNLNRLTRVVLPDSDVPADPFGEPVYNNPYTETTYTRSGLKETERNPNGVVKHYEYNVRKWLKQVIVNGVVLSTNEYDAVGRVTKTTDAEGTAVQYDYDYLGNVLCKRLIGTDEIKTVYTYDSDGNKTSETDGYASSKFTRFEYDSLGRLSKTIKANGGATQYDYDPVGNLRRITDAKGYSSFSYYNRLGWLFKETDSLQEETSYTYDQSGRKTGVVDRKGQTSVYAYYDSGRLQEVSFSDGVKITYEYDAAGNKSRVVQTGTAQTVETRYNYDEAAGLYVTDPQNRVNTIVRSIGAASYTTRYEYDMAGNVARVLYPGSSEWIQYDRDNFDRVVEVPGFTQSPSAGKNGVECDKAGVMTRLTMANGIQLDVTPDKFHRPVIMNYHKVGQTVPPALKLEYQYRPHEMNIDAICKSDASGVETARYTYDNMNQLSSEGRTEIPGTKVDQAVLSKSEVAVGGQFDIKYYWWAAPTATPCQVETVFIDAKMGTVLWKDRYSPCDTTTWSGWQEFTHTITVPSSYNGSRIDFNGDVIVAISLVAGETRIPLGSNGLGSAGENRYQIGSLRLVNSDDSYHDDRLSDDMRDSSRVGSGSTGQYSSIYKAYRAVTQTLTTSYPLYKDTCSVSRILNSWTIVREFQVFVDEQDQELTFTYPTNGTGAVQLLVDGVQVGYHSSSSTLTTWSDRWDVSNIAAGLHTVQLRLCSAAFGSIQNDSISISVTKRSELAGGTLVKTEAVTLAQPQKVYTRGYPNTSRWTITDTIKQTGFLKEIAINLTKTFSRSGTLSIQINGTYVFNGTVGTRDQTVLSAAKDVSTITKNGDIQIVAAFVADEPEPPGGMSVAAVETASGNGFDVLLTKKLVQTRSYTFLSVPLDTERKVTKLTGFTATSTGVSWSVLDEDETVSLLNGEFVLKTPGKKIQLKATFSQRSDAKPGNAIQGYSAQTVLAPLPSDSLVTEHSYSYDLKGNRSLYDSSGLTYYPGTDRLKQTPDAAYVYDDNGNLTEKTTNDGTKLTYSYDVRNLLTEVQRALPGESPVTIARYLYDSEGNRIQSDYPVDGSSVLYQFDLSGQLTENPIMEERAGSTWNFIYLNRQLLARVDGTIGTGTKYWYAVDHLGSNRRMLDQNGNVVWWADYEAFGKVKATGGTVSEVPRFTGKAWDEKVGLYYFNARWYEPGLGRFMGEDPAPIDIKDPVTANLTCYCRSNPLIFLDPSGATVVYYTYDRQGAVAYALAHTKDAHIPGDTGSYNPDYPHYGSNCTNFVSQCLAEGGELPENAAWYYGFELLGKSVATRSWHNADAFHSFLKNEGWINSETSCIGSASDAEKLEAMKGLKLGDVVQMQSSDGDIHHTMIVTGIDPVTVTYNSQDRQDIPLTTVMSNNPGDTYLMISIKDEVPVPTLEPDLTSSSSNSSSSGEVTMV